MLESVVLDSVLDATSMPTTAADDNDTSCVWNKVLIPNDDSLLNEHFATFYTVSAAASVACTSYLMWKKETFRLKRLAYPESYKLFCLFILATHLRVVVPKLCRFIIKFANPDYINCEICAFVDTFLSVFEIETLTHLCIERYVIAKYITRGWNINNNHYKLYYNLCLFFSLLYSIPPIFNLGKYAKDFNCDSCCFDMVLFKDGIRYVVVTIWVLRSIKPAIFMLLMLIWARQLEAKFTIQMKMKSDIFFTRFVETVTTACLFFWTPLAAVRGSVIYSQLLDGEISFHTKEYVHFAMTLYEISPILVTLAVVMTNKGMIIPIEDPNKQN